MRGRNWERAWPLTQSRRIAHHVDQFNLVVQGCTVIVEGGTEGELADGSRWAVGTTPGGRFCSVFEHREGKIARMHIYLDAGHDAARFLLGLTRSW